MSLSLLRPWPILAALLVAAGLREGPAGAAGEPPPADAQLPAVLHFRRVYAPADRIEDWPRGNVPYMPIDAAEFERLLKAARTARPGGGASAAARVVAARYRARLSGEGPLVGQAEFEVVHGAEAPVLLPLDPCNLAIGKASWDPQPSEASGNPGAGNDAAPEAEPQPAPASLGAGVGGNLAVLVERSGRLTVDWSLRGTHPSSDTVDLDMQLPRCPVNQFLLDLPEDVVPVADVGVLHPGVPVEGGSAGLRRWRIELGGRHRFHLALEPADAAARRPPLALVRQTGVYDFSLSGLEVSARLQLEVHHEPLREVRLALDPEVQLVSARDGDGDLPWLVTSDPDAPVTRVVVSLREPLEGMGRVLRFGALAPLQLDRPWELPRIRAEGMVWQEGTSTLLVPSSLVIEELTPVGCRQTDTAPLSAPRSGESARFQHFSRDATVRLVLARRSELMQVATGTAITLSGGEMTASVRAHFQVADSPRFSIEADVGRQWLIDSVESVPPDAIDDWIPPEHSRNRRKLTIRLLKAVSPAQPLRLLIAARRLQSPLTRRLGIEDLEPLRFSDVEGSPPLVAVATMGPYLLELHGDERLARVEPGSLQGEQRQLFAQPPDGLLFKNDAAAADLQISLQPQEPSYTGEVRAEAFVGDGTLREGYRLRCVPRSGLVRRVLVHFSVPREAPLQWSLVSEDESQLAARRLPSDEQVAVQGPPEDETWELKLARPQNAPFEIQGSREIELAGEQPVSLVSLPEATGQRATLVVRSLRPHTVRIKNNRLRSIPAETVGPERCRTALGTYRYDPLGNTAADAEPAVTVSLAGDPATMGACVWDSHVESCYEVDGTGKHLATCRLQSSGSGRIRLALQPAEAIRRVDAVWLDERRVAGYPREGTGRNRITLELPEAEKFPTVSIHFTTIGPPLGTIGSRRPPRLQTDLPVLSQRWTVWLPPAYAAYGPDPRWQPARSPRLTWSQRLFGPMGRGAREPAFAPLVPGTWSPAVSRHAARRLADHRSGQLLQMLGAVAAGPENGGTDWAGLLGHPSLKAFEPDLLVDRRALARLGLGPRSSVRPVGGATAAQRGVRLLQRAELALLAHGDVTVLTSQTQAALDHDYLRPLAHRVAWEVLPGPLAERMHHASVAGRAGPLTVVEAWKEQPGQPSVLWQRAGPADAGSGDAPGWTAYRLELADPSATEPTPVRLKFFRRDTMRLLGWLSFLLLVAVLWWKAVGRPILLISTAGGFGCAALLLPAAYVPVASAGVMAALFCLGLHLIRRRVAPQSPSADATQSPAAQDAASAAIQLGILILGGAAIGAWCGTTYAGAPAEKAPVNRVFIPIDDDKQPTGGKYYVPVTFYDQLYRRAAEASEKPQGWLIAGATYRGSLAKAPTSDGLVVEELRASFDLKVFGGPGRVEIPLRREGVNLLPDGSLLDGRPIQPEWKPGGEGLTVDVSQPGRCRLELALRPTVAAAGTTSGFELTIPRLATSRLELALPPDAPAVEVPSAMGSIRRTVEPSQLVAELGPTDRLTVRWPGRNGSGAGAAAVDVEQLFWLSVRPGSVVVDAKLQFKVIEGHMQVIELAADPRLRLLPAHGADSPSVQIRTVPGQSQIVVLRWPQPVADTASVETSFLWTGSSGVGSIRLPQLQVRGARPTRRWLAVSVDPALEHELPSSGRFEALAVPDFLAAWGAAESAPLFAYRLGLDEDAWSMSTRPPETRTEVDQTLSLTFDRAEAEVHLDARLTTTAGYVFQHRVRAPAGLRVEEVSVTEEGAQRAARWAQNDDGLITVFLSGRVEGPHELALRGRLAAPTRGKMPLPTLQIEHARRGSSKVLLYRRPSVRVAVNRTNGLAELSDVPPEVERPERGRLVRCFEVAEGKPIRALLSLAPNRPQVRVEQVTWLYSTGDSWTTQLQYRLRVGGGVLDEIRIDVPGQLGGPYRLEGSPPATLSQRGLSDGRRRLIVRPEMEISGEYEFRISSELQIPPGGRAAAPDVRPLGVDRLRRLVALPGRAQGQPIAWETQGLRASELPEGFAAPTEAVSFTTYEVGGAAFRTIRRPAEHARPTATVRLADIRVAWQADGRCHGVATYDLEPGRASTCPLRLPAGYRLVRVNVAGVPVAPVPVRAGAWTLPLGPDRLPQRVEVLFTADLPAAGRSARQRFEAPSLGDLPVEETLWTVAGPPSAEASHAEGVQATVPWRHELARLRSAAAMIESASRASSEDPEETLRWYRVWARRLIAARTALKQTSTGSGPGRRAQLEVRRVDQQQARIAQRLGMGNVLSQLAAETPVADDPDELWQWWLAPRRSLTRYAFSEWTGSLGLRCRPVGGGRPAGRLAAAVLLGLGTVLTVSGLRRGWVAALLRQWPAAAGVVLGLAWWLWLSPSVLGWAIVLTSLVASWRSGWRRSAQPPGSSVISLRSIGR